MERVRNGEMSREFKVMIGVYNRKEKKSLEKSGYNIGMSNSSNH